MLNSIANATAATTKDQKPHIKKKAHRPPQQPKDLAEKANAQAEICAHLYQKGFMNGLLSDISVTAFDQQFQLHRLLLVRSPYFERTILGSNATSSNTKLELPVASYKRITHESLSICLSFLYAASITTHIHAGNVKSVLACSFLLELKDVATMTTEYLISHVDAGNILSLVELVQDYSKTSATTATSSFSAGFISLIKKAAFEFLATELPRQLEAFNDSPEGQKKLAEIYAVLPFEWLKTILEERLGTPREYEKYLFSRTVMETRKAKNLGSESVVLLFDRDARGRVALK